MCGDGDCSGNAALLLQIFAQTRTHYSTTNTTLHAYSHLLLLLCHSPTLHRARGRRDAVYGTVTMAVLAGRGSNSS